MLNNVNLSLNPRFAGLSLCQERFFKDYTYADTYLNASKRRMGKAIQKQLDWKPGLLHWFKPLAQKISDRLDAMNLDVKIVPDGGDMAGGPVADTYNLVLGRKGSLAGPKYDSWHSAGTRIQQVETTSPTALLHEIPFAVAQHFQRETDRLERSQTSLRNLVG